MNKSLIFTVIACILSIFPVAAETGFFLLSEGPVATYEYRKGVGKETATYTVTIRDKSGELQNGGQTIVYHYFKSDGTPFFKEPNEMLKKTERRDGQTYVVMDELMKTMKVKDILPVGDVSAIPVSLTVGTDLPNSTMKVKMGKINADVTIVDKKVLDHKSITTPAGTFDCWLVHEKALMTVYSRTMTTVADTWYALSVGIVKQTVTDEDGKITASTQLISLK